MRDLPLHPSPLRLAVVVSVFVLAVGSRQCLGQGNEQLKQRLLKEAPSRWEEYTRLSEQLQGVLSVSRTGTLEDVQYHNQTEYKANGSERLLKDRTKRSRGGKAGQEVEQVFATNPRYAFTLTRRTPQLPWVITNLLQRTDSSDLGPVRFELDDYLRCVTCAVRLDRAPLTEVLRQPGFQMGECRNVQRGGDELVEVAFTYSKVERSGKKQNLSGKLVFDPNRYWCLSSADLQVNGDVVSGTQNIRISQSANAGDLPPLSRVYESDADMASSDGAKNHQLIRYDVTLSQPARVPADKDFTLSAFDLPEPFAAPATTPRWYIWAGVAGILSLVLGVLLHYRRRRASLTTRPVEEEAPHAP